MVIKFPTKTHEETWLFNHHASLLPSRQRTQEIFVLVPGIYLVKYNNRLVLIISPFWKTTSPKTYIRLVNENAGINERINSNNFNLDTGYVSYFPADDIASLSEVIVILKSNATNRSCSLSAESDKKQKALFLALSTFLSQDNDVRPSSAWFFQ